MNYISIKLLKEKNATELAMVTDDDNNDNSNKNNYHLASIIRELYGTLPLKSFLS